MSRRNETIEPKDMGTTGLIQYCLDSHSRASGRRRVFVANQVIASRHTSLAEKNEAARRFSWALNEAGKARFGY